MIRFFTLGLDEFFFIIIVPRTTQRINGLKTLFNRRKGFILQGHLPNMIEVLGANFLEKPGKI